MSVKPWYDASLLLYVAVFFTIEAVMLVRETRLGWVMVAKCFSLASTFLYGYVLIFMPVELPVLVAIRLSLCASLTMAVEGMLRARTDWSMRRRVAFCLGVLALCVVVTQALYALHGLPR